MFAVLRVKENEKGFINRLKFKLKPPAPKLERVPVKSAAPYYYLELFENQCGEKFEEVAEMLGRCAGFIITCDGFMLPSDSLCDYYRPSRLPQTMLLNSAVEYAAEKSRNNSWQSIGIIDPKANFANCIEKLIVNVPSVKVVTDCPQQYENTAQALYDNWGFSLVVSQNISAVSDCDMIISPETNEQRIYNRRIVINNKDSLKHMELRGEGFTLPKEYERIMPQGVEPLTFASALYELCGVSELSAMSYNGLIKVCD